MEKEPSQHQQQCSGLRRVMRAASRPSTFHWGAAAAGQMNVLSCGRIQRVCINLLPSQANRQRAASRAAAEDRERSVPPHTTPHHIPSKQHRTRAAASQKSPLAIALERRCQRG
ncbi:hypothetical protein PLESTF_001641300 [Pleodorina starrii]|nr:hypothetical protein PLESTF_001641300 [Pleodorina starrii]